MDDPRPPFEAAHPLQGPHDDFPAEAPPGFVPLRLVLQPGGLCVELTRPEILLGRHSRADVRLALPDVSRRHCRFVFRDGQWRVFDLNSLNGVHVNGERMHEANLYDGDELRVGGFTFRVSVAAGAPTVVFPGHAAGPEADMIRSIAEALPQPERRKAS